MDDQTGQSGGWSRRSVLRSIGLAGVGVAGVTVTPAIPTEPAAARPQLSFTTEDVTVESFDGTEIAATAYLPSTDGPRPSVLMTHGWGANRQSLILQATSYVTNGYAVLTYDSRGFGESGGRVTLNGQNEVGDAVGLVSWLADHDAVATDDDGEPQVGVDGSSYGGAIQFRAAAADDRLDAIVPRITWRDLPEAHAPNDVFKVAWTQALQAAGESGGDVDPEVEGLTEAVVERRELTDEFRTFYRSRSPTTYLQAVDTPTLLVHSWYDRLFTPDQPVANFRELTQQGVETSLVLQDAGGHHLGGAPAATTAERSFVHDATLSWMDAHVADEGDHGLSAVSLYDDSSDSFVTADRFPPADVDDREYDLAIDGSVLLGDPSGAEASAGETVATFDFEVDEETEVLGAPTLEASVVPRGEGTVRLAVALKHVTDDGATTIKDQVTPVAVERPTRLDLELFPVHRVLAAGDRLRLAVATRDQAIDDVEIPTETSDTGAFVDTDAGTGAVLQSNGPRGATLSVPVRESGSAGATGSGGWWWG